MGMLPVVRLLYFMTFMSAGRSGHVQSLLRGGVFILFGSLTCIPALLADLFGWNRMLIQRALEKIQRVELALEQEKRAERSLSSKGWIDASTSGTTAGF